MTKINCQVQWEGAFDFQNIMSQNNCVSVPGVIKAVSNKNDLDF